MKHPGKLLVIEGCEGAGKSSVLVAVREALVAHGIDPVVTREPGGTSEGTAIRKLLVSSGGGDWQPMAEFLLIAADRAQHVAHVIGPALENGRVVLCDRYVGSTLAYQGAGRGLPDHTLRQIHDLSTGALWPDVTLVLDVEPEIGLARSRRRLAAQSSSEGRFEALGVDFHRRVRQSFLEQAKTNPGRHVVIDANRAEDLVRRDAVEAIVKLLVRTAWDSALLDDGV
jgi:dTMP kinase